jgi:flagellar motor component MotA
MQRYALVCVGDLRGFVELTWYRPCGSRHHRGRSAERDCLVRAAFTRSLHDRDRRYGRCHLRADIAHRDEAGAHASALDLPPGLQLVVDGSEPEVVRSVMEVELDVREQANLRAAKVFEGMGVYAPTMGIIGAVLGLMSVMQNLADPSKLGVGIAAAFVATVYGIGLANLLFLPIANKLKNVIHAQSQIREMMIEALVAITQGDNPRSLEMRLQGYLH